MKRVIAVLIALLAFSLLIPTILGLPPLLVGSPSKNLSVPTTGPDTKLHEQAMQALYTTPTVASFLNNTWSPGMPINNTENNNTWSIYSEPTVLGGNAPGSILGFLAANDTIPTAPSVEVAQTYSGTPAFKFHQMN